MDTLELINKRLEEKAEKMIEGLNLDKKEWKLFHEFSEFDVKAVNENLPEEVKELKVGDIVKIEGYMSTFKNADRQNDVVLDGAFDESLKKQKVYTLQRNHSYDTQDMLGDWKGSIDETGLYMKGEIVVTPNNLHEVVMIKAGKLKTLSMGGIFRYSPEKDKKGCFVIEKVLLLEGSVVTVPANDKAKFEAKSFYIENSEEVPQEKPTEVSKYMRVKAIEEILKRKGV